MKALLINGSPRTNGCTFTVLTELKNTLEKEGIDAEIIHVGHKDIHGCTAYRKCAQTGKSVFDDIVNEVAPKFAEADAFVIGAPVYYASPAGGAISFLDRLFFSNSKIDKTMKVGAAVVTCRRGGNTASFDVLNKYFSINSMPIASSQYWNMVYGGQAEEVLLDTEGLQTMRTLGRNIAFMVKSFAPGKKQILSVTKWSTGSAHTQTAITAQVLPYSTRLITDTSARQATMLQATSRWKKHIKRARFVQSVFLTLTRSRFAKFLIFAR